MRQKWPCQWYSACCSLTSTCIGVVLKLEFFRNYVLHGQSLVMATFQEETP